MVTPMGMMPGARKSGWGWAVGLGAAAITILVCLGTASPAASCGDPTAAPMTAFQTARSPTDLAILFGTAETSCRTDLIEGLQEGNWVDLLLFIPLYGAFLFSVMIALRWRSKTLSLFLIAALLATICGDVIETATQLRILHNLDAGPALLDLLMVGNTVKTLGLALVMLGLAASVSADRARISQITAILLVALAVTRMASVVMDGLRPLTPLTALAAYGVLWAYAIWRLNRRRLALKR